MSLDPAALDTIEKHINKHWHRCPMCYFRKWEAVGFAPVAIGSANSTTFQWGRGIPSVALMCGQCGLVVHVATAAIEGLK